MCSTRTGRRRASLREGARPAAALALGTAAAAVLAAVWAAGLTSCAALLPSSGDQRAEAQRPVPGGIYRAAAEGDLPGLQQALAADPGLLEARDKGGWSAASHAAWARQKQAYDYLRQRGASTTVYTEAALGPLPSLMERLDAARALVDARDPVQRATPLHWAVRAGNRVACDLLLARGAQIDAPDGAGAAPLHYAVLAGDAETADLLLRAGADPAAADGQGRTPLHQAVEAGSFELVALLLDAGAPIDAADHRGDTPLHLGATRGSFELCEYLLALGARPAPRNAAGRTPLDLARQNGHDPVVRLLETQTR